MKKRMWVCSILVILSLLLAPAGSVQAQDQRPPKPPHPVNPTGGSLGPYSRFQAENDGTGIVGGPGAAGEISGSLQDNDGRWYMDGSAEEQGVSAVSDISAQAVADTYGYTYKSVPYNWADATGGTLMEETYQYVDLPFDFPFYGEGYSVITVSQYGHLVIGDYTSTNGASPMLESSEPNNVIAPYWSWLYPNTSRGDDGGVYMDTGEDETGQYVVFEWYNMTDRLGNISTGDFNNYSFEVILYEDGRVIFQYGEMYYPRGYQPRCGSAGIEDWTGTVGRATLKFCALPKGYRGVQFTPPTVPAARVQVFPLDYGALAAPGTEAEVSFTVHNNGTLDDDVYDFVVKSKWPVTLFGEDDMGEFQPLEDTDADKKLDTGLLCQGCSMRILAKTLVPVTAVSGNSLTSTVTVASSLKTSRKATVTIQTTVPAAFTQAYQADWEDQVKYFSPTTGITSVETNTDSWWGNNPVVTTLPNGNTVSLWSDYYCDDNGDCPYEELYYRVNDSQGAFVAGNAKVQDLTGQTDVWDFNAALAPAPDGSTGITWVHEVRSVDEDENSIYQYNIYFAILNPAGEVSYGPVDITQNEDFFSYEDYSGKMFYSPHIAAAADNRFLLTWRQYEYVDNLPHDNIYTAILDTTGGVVQAVTERTLDRGDVNDNYYDDSGYYESSVTALTNNRFLLSWAGWEAKKWQRTYKVYYQVLGSNGAPITAVTAVSTGAYSNYGLDGAQMSGGQIILAWNHGTKQAWNSKASIYYIVLNDLTYKKAKGPVGLTHKAALTGSGYVSVTTDNLNHAILTWVDNNAAFGKHLYYALLGKNGTVLTKPAVILSNFDRWQGEISVSACGYGNAPYPVAPDR